MVQLINIKRNDFQVLGVNSYPSKCVDCEDKVYPGQGVYYRNINPDVKRQYDVRCMSCANLLLNKRRE